MADWLAPWQKIFGAKPPADKPKPSPPDRVAKPVQTPVVRVGLPDTQKLPATHKEFSDGSRTEVFDPALLHFRKALRQGDPTIPDSQERQAWHAARRQVMEYVLECIAASNWKDHLLLRGSMLLKAWLGDAAREPRDMDWVVIPESMGILDSDSRRMLNELISVISGGSVGGEIVIDGDEMEMDEIWTYERAPGKRLVFPWRKPGLPEDVVQLDFVFNEKLFSEPVESSLLLGNGKTIAVRSASREQSLAWKIVWLETDTYPQGKDLYDAVLLAQGVTAPLQLLQQSIDEATSPRHRRKVSADLPARWRVDWDNFLAEYPTVVGGVAEWKGRLSAALAASIAAG